MLLPAALHKILVVSAFTEDDQLKDVLTSALEIARDWILTAMESTSHR